MNSRFWLLGTILVAMAAVLVACAAPAPTATPTTAPMAVATPTKAPTATPTKMPVTKISVASFAFDALSYSAPVLGKGKGYFQEESLDIDWVVTGSGAKALAAVVGRSAHIGLITAGDTIAAVAQGQPAKVFALASIGMLYFSVIRKEVADQRRITPQMSLTEKGKAVKGLVFGATSPGSGTDQMTRLFLISAGLDPDRDVEITYMASTALGPALEAGAIDVVTIAQPGQTLDPIRRGKAVMLANFAAGDIPGVGDVLNISAVGHRDEMKAQPQIFEAFTRALWRAQKLIEQNPNEAKEVVRKTEFPDMDQQLYEDYWNRVSQGIAKSSEVTEKRFIATLELRNKTEPGPPLTANFSDFYDSRFVEAAKKQLGY